MRPCLFRTPSFDNHASPIHTTFSTSLILICRPFGSSKSVCCSRLRYSMQLSINVELIRLTSKEESQASNENDTTRPRAGTATCNRAERISGGGWCHLYGAISYCYIMVIMPLHNHLFVSNIIRTYLYLVILMVTRIKDPPSLDCLDSNSHTLDVLITIYENENLPI